MVQIGHFFTLHFSACAPSPLHSGQGSRTVPSTDGAVHALFLSRSPPPQLLEQRPQEPHEDQLPYLQISEIEYSSSIKNKLAD